MDPDARAAYLRYLRSGDPGDLAPPPASIGAPSWIGFLRACAAEFESGASDDNEFKRLYNQSFENRDKSPVDKTQTFSNALSPLVDGIGGRSVSLARKKCTARLVSSGCFLLTAIASPN